MEFLYGVLGAVAVLAAVSAGGLVGWKMRGKWEQLRKPVAEAASEDVLHKLKEEQAAFNALQNYTADMAYGVDADPLAELHKE